MGGTEWAGRPPPVSWRRRRQQAVEDPDRRVPDLLGAHGGRADGGGVGKAPDLFEGVMKPELYLSDALGAVGKPMFRVHTAGSVGGSSLRPR